MPRAAVSSKNNSPDARRAAPTWKVLGGNRGGESIAGRKVAAWVSQSTFAHLTSVSARHIQRLERKGLPNRGNHASKEYPIPHALVWFIQHCHLTQNERQVVELLDPEVAFMAYELDALALEKRTAGQHRITRRRPNGQDPRD